MKNAVQRWRQKLRDKKDRGVMITFMQVSL